MKKTVKNLLIALLVPLVVYLVFLIPNAERFGTWNVLSSIFIQSLIPAIMGFAVSLGWITHIIDFSIGSRMIISALIGSVLSQQFGVAGLLIGGIGTCVILGIITGILNNVLRIPALITTLGLCMAFEIVGYRIGMMFPSATRLSPDNTVLGINYILLIISAGAAILFYIVYYRFRVTYHIRAVGTNAVLAKNMGINVDKTKLMSFILGSVFLGLAAVLQMSYSGSVTIQTGMASTSALFKPLIGVLIGLALGSWCNFAVGIIIGAFTVNIIFVGLVALGLHDAYQNVVLGVFIIVIMFITENKQKITAFFKRFAPKKDKYAKQAN